MHVEFGTFAVVFPHVLQLWLVSQPLLVLSPFPAGKACLARPRDLEFYTCKCLFWSSGCGPPVGFPNL